MANESDVGSDAEALQEPIAAPEVEEEKNDSLALDVIDAIVLKVKAIKVNKRSIDALGWWLIYKQYARK